jgi:hypothetical protein
LRHAGALLQATARQHGAIDTFSDDEIELAGRFPESTLMRAWHYWKARLPRAQAM